MKEESPRQHRKFHLALPLRVRFGKSSPGSAAAADEHPEGLAEGMMEEEETSTTAISSESCFFFVAKKPPLGAAASMRVEIPLRASGRAGSVLCQGRVLWVSDQEVEGKIGVACTIESFTFQPPGRTEGTEGLRE